MKLTALAFFASLISVAALGQLAPNAPKDQPIPVQDAQTIALDKAIAPYVAKAKETYPNAKERYLAGLPRGEIFFVTTRLHDAKGRMEQVFIRVAKIDGSKITGKVSSQVQLVTGYAPGQDYSFPEVELIDWLIAKPDGSEEGWFVVAGKQTFVVPL